MNWKWLLAVGVLAFTLAGLSVADMYLPRPYDGVALEGNAPGRLGVRQVVPGSGAAAAGIQPGDQIVGIGRSILRSKGHAAAILNEHRVGELVPYLIERQGRLEERVVELGPRRIGDTSYAYVSFLGFCFFGIGLFVLLQQPRLTATQVFFLLCCLFLLVLVCRLRPASYSWVDTFVLNTGTAALVLLPAAFLHFFLIFPRPIWQDIGRGLPPEGRRSSTWKRLLVALYLAPLLVLVGSLALCALRGQDLRILSGAPLASWWILAAYMLLGLTALAANAARLPASRERAGAALVFAGSLLGVLPFLVLAVVFPSILGTDEFAFYGVVPLLLVPVTFAYAIIRYQLLDVRVILRKSLLYTATTAVVTGVYALGIAAFNRLFQGSSLASSPYFPFLLALAIILLFEPLRRRLQVPVDRFFFARRARLQSAMVEMGEAFTAGADPAAVAHDLVEKLPRLLEVEFAALYLRQGDRLEREAGPAFLPASLPRSDELYWAVRGAATLSRTEELAARGFQDPAAREVVAALAAAGIEAVGDLTSPRRRIGMVVLAGRPGRMPLEQEELRLLRGLFHQAGAALETSFLLEERARQAELERELEIAAAIQASLLPRGVSLAAGWRVATLCRPARQVGGDFFAELPGPNGHGQALVYGDVSGKSVPGALMMMAAKEVLHSLALAYREPEELIARSNQRLCELGNRGFVALGYLSTNGDGGGLRYILAGQPPPLKRTAAGEVTPLPLAEHRLPLGAMRRGRHRALCVPVEVDEVILAYSDGVVEARSAAGEFFGEERLAALLASCPPDPDEVVRQTAAALAEFTRGTEAYDDLTLLAIARAAPLAAPPPEEIRGEISKEIAKENP